MAGAGWRDWSAGEVVTESLIQEYLQDQVVPVFNNTTARNNAITSPSAGMVCAIKDVAHLQMHNGAAWYPVAQADPWYSYTPSVNGSIRNLSIGNGSMEGRYVRLGSTVHFFSQVTWGSTTVSALGNLSMSRPPVAPRSGSGQVAHVLIWDDSARRYWAGMAMPVGSGGMVPLYITTGGGYMIRATDVLPDGNVLGGTGDILRMWGVLEAAVTTA